MAGNPNIADYGKNTRITPENAKERQSAGVEARKRNKTIQQILEDHIADGSFESFVNNEFKKYEETGDSFVLFKLLEMRDKYEDKQDSRANGELENKVIVYKGMDIEEVK